MGARQVRTLRDLASRTGDARTAEIACARAAESLATNPCDLPFALLYLAGEDRRQRAAGRARRDRRRATPPRRRRSRSATAACGRSPRRCAALRRSSSRRRPTCRIPLPTGAWERTPERIAIVGISPSGDRGRGRDPGRGPQPAPPVRRELPRLRRSHRRPDRRGASPAPTPISCSDRRAEELAAIDRAKTAFFSNVSHEFRTPLTLMLGPTEDALDQGSLEGESLKMVHRNQLRLLKMVNNLLDFARIEAGRMQASYAPTDLGALTADLASSFRAAVERAGLGFTVSCEALPEPVFVDREMWERVVLNLLSNAFKFTLAGSIGVSLRPCRRRGRARGQRHRLGHPRSGARPHLRALPPRRRRARAHARGLGHRPGAGPRAGAAARRRDRRSRRCWARDRRSWCACRPARRTCPPTGSSATPPRGRSAVGCARRLERRRALRRGGAALAARRRRRAPGRAGGHSRARRRPAAACWSPTTTPTCASTSGACSSRAGRSRRSAPAAPRSQAARARAPDLILTDVMMPELDGFGLLRALDDDPRLRAIPGRDAVGARGRGGAHRGAAGRRRRLPGQAVLGARAARAHRCPDPARARRAARSRPSGGASTRSWRRRRWRSRSSRART